ncbi:unnamed protein product [Porites evermanni]|uniref:Uncharacterized protein n=1 Tax=Porites evermanni TaxID=104178 RepID=A0ABN8PVZ0_9CNID|nr:unnamed protein product [Porites evermanni]
MLSHFSFIILSLLVLPRASANIYENVHNLLTPNEIEKIFGEPFLQSSKWRDR